MKKVVDKCFFYVYIVNVNGVKGSRMVINERVKK